MACFASSDFGSIAADKLQNETSVGLLTILYDYCVFNILLWCLQISVKAGSSRDQFIFK
jgi:hypothetical protein